MSLTIKDIAKFAGVSHTTVSRVINNYPNVKPETREKILGLIKDLNFSPHISARSLSSGKSYTIGLLILYDLEQFPVDFLPSILVGMTTELNRCKYNLTLLFDQVQGKRNQVPFELSASNNLDGVFILSVETEVELAYRIAKIDLPMVLVNQKIEDLNLNYVVADDEGGAYAATSHLLDLGHKKIAFIGGTPKYITSKDRKSGYRRALREHGITPEPSIEKIGFFDRNHGYEAVRELLEQRQDITAIFAANDLMALGAYKAIKERGLSIPNDIAVVGFDDADFAELIDPPLTTVKKSRTLMGSESARLMMDLLNSQDEGKVKQILMPTRLIVRESSGRL